MPFMPGLVRYEATQDTKTNTPAFRVANESGVVRDGSESEVIIGQSGQVIKYFVFLELAVEVQINPSGIPNGPGMPIEKCISPH